MKSYFLGILLLGFLQLADIESATSLNSFSSNFTGQLGNKTDVFFSLKNNNGKLSGFYYYEKIGIEIKLVGEIINGLAIIYELDYQNVKQAKITGKLTQSSFRGAWESLSSKKVFPIQLKSTNKSMPMLPNDLLGAYKVEEQNKCALNINITKNKGQYFYHFKNLKRDLKGKVTFSRSLEENLVYINLHGIEWEEDSGDVTNEDDEHSSADRELPTIVQGLLSDGEILIQNTGNAMNRYVKISQCDLKYIHLKRVK